MLWDMGGKAYKVFNNLHIRKFVGKCLLTFYYTIVIINFEI